jgi:hypothetical protein
MWGGYAYWTGETNGKTCAARSLRNGRARLEYPDCKSLFQTNVPPPLTECENLSNRATNEASADQKP